MTTQRRDPVHQGSKHRSSKHENEEIAAALRACTRVGAEGATRAVARVATSGDLAVLVDEAIRHRVLGLVARVVPDVPGVDPEILEALELHTIAQAVHQLRVLDDLRGFADTMDRAGIVWLTFKGPVLAQLLYEPPQVRGYQDLDLLVPRAEFRRAIEALEAAGAEVLDRNWTLIGRERRGQLHVRLRLGTIADAHWHLLNRQSVRATFDVPMDEVVARARAAEVAGLDVLTLDPVDTLVHLCLHAALGGGDRLAWLADVERAIVVEQPPWDEVAARAREWRSGAATAAILRRTRDVLGAPVPESVLRALDPSSVRRRLGARMDRRWAPDAPHGAHSLSTMWTQVVRDGPADTATAAVRRAARPVANALRRLRGEPGVAAHETSGAVLKPSGGEAARRTYLAWVAAVTDSPRNG
jgi:hypothetical protein